MTRPLFDRARTDLLRTALAGYTVDSVRDLLGLVGDSALSRGDLAGVARILRALEGEPLATLVRLFLLADEVTESAAGRAMHPLPLAAAAEAGLLTLSGGAARALLDIRPHAQHLGGAAEAAGWWVVSDFGADVRGGELRSDHVLGIGGASLTLAQATPRLGVGRALDIGTGCGVQALHLGTHCAAVVATDVSPRALRFAATTAALSGQEWDLRTGSLLEPVAGEAFDLVVANPPFVVSDGAPGSDYRDSGLAGDGCSAALVEAIPGVLAPGGSAHLLANWIIPAEGTWIERVSGWLAGSGCDAWVWQREVADPGEYVAMWLRDAGLTPHEPGWAPRYDAWLDWFARAGVAGVGMGLISMWRTERADPIRVLEDVPQGVEQPVGSQLPQWIARQRWLADTDDDALLAGVLRPATDLVRERSDLLGAQGWATAGHRLRQSHGMRWSLETDEAVAAVVAGCDGTRSLYVPLQVLAASLERPVDEIAAALLPVVRDLVGRAILVPEALGQQR